MIRNPKDDLKADTDRKVRSLAEQFRGWLSESMEKVGLEYSDEGILALYTLLTMKGSEIMGLGGEETGRWVVGMSAFLGECIRTRFGGEYFRSGDQGFGLRLPGAQEIYPIRWVQGQLSDGKKNSVLVRYELLVSSRAGNTAKDPDEPHRPVE
jgi:hypothetical protein